MLFLFLLIEGGSSIGLVIFPFVSPCVNVKAVCDDGSQLFPDRTRVEPGGTG